MKIVLIATNPSAYSPGIRAISAYLKSHGHDVICIFLAWFEAELTYEEFITKDLKALRAMLIDCDLIGISCISKYYYYAVHVFNKLQDLNKPIILGGIHATLYPEECLKNFDIVCIGEGETALLDLTDRMEKKQDIYTTPNFWFKKDNTIIKNAPGALIQDIDSLPIPDYEFSDHYFFDGDKLYPIRPEYFRDISYYGIYGCPHNCSYCCNLPLYKASVDDDKCKGVKIRKRSIKKVIDDLEIIISKFSDNLEIQILDSTFFIRSMSEFKYFSYEYKKRINRALSVYVSPQTFNEEKLKWLIKAGNITILMGIESGSEKINFDIFNRKIKNQKILEVVKIINKYQHNMFRPPTYEIIIRNPYENKNDKFNTLKLMHQFPKPYILGSSGLLFLPGSDLYKRAITDGLIKSLDDAIKNKNNIDLTAEIISIDDILGLMDNCDFVFYGPLYSGLIDSFINRNIDLIPLRVEVIVPEYINQIIKKEIRDKNKRLYTIYLLRIVTFLRHVPQNTDETLLSALDDYHFTRQMQNDYFKYKEWQQKLQTIGLNEIVLYQD